MDVAGNGDGIVVCIPACNLIKEISAKTIGCIIICVTEGPVRCLDSDVCIVCTI